MRNILSWSMPEALYADTSLSWFPKPPTQRPPPGPHKQSCSCTRILVLKSSCLHGKCREGEGQEETIGVFFWRRGVQGARGGLLCGQSFDCVAFLCDERAHRQARPLSPPHPEKELPGLFRECDGASRKVQDAVALACNVGHDLG
jgi:hypothetical protein